MSEPKIIDFPKLHSPFVRETIDGRYIVTPKIAEDFDWVFEPGVRAVDKLDGTNVCVRIRFGKVDRVFNRTTEKYLMSIKMTRWESACMEGIARAIHRGWLENFPDGDHYGELIGEIINGNRHQVAGHIWVPFSYLYDKCHWHSWVQNKYPKTFETISEWFKELPSLFNQRMKWHPIQAEGLVFMHPDGRMAKLRRDMWPWYHRLFLPEALMMINSQNEILNASPR